MSESHTDAPVPRAVLYRQRPPLRMTLIAWAVLMPLSGCAGLPKSLGSAGLTNHLLVSVDETLCMTASRWGWLAITGDLRESECAAIVEGQRLRLLMRLQAAQKGGA